MPSNDTDLSLTKRTLGRTALLGAFAGLIPGSALARGDTPLTGLWKLVSYEVEIRSSGEKDPVMGAHPTGYAYFTPENRVFFMLTGEDRKASKDVEGEAHLLETMVAYTGRFTVDGDQWTAKLDAAWNPKWVDTEQTRTFRLEGTRLRVMTPWRVMPNWAKQGETRSIVTFERATEN